MSVNAVEDLAESLALLVNRAIQTASNSTDRSEQQQSYVLGMSDLGHCREYARRMIEQIPFTDERDKTPAFIGSILGGAIEAAIARVDPNSGWVFQDEVITTLPSGVRIMGHPDMYNQHVVGDLKSKDGTEVARKMDPTQQQYFQKHGYGLGLVQAGKCDPDGLMVANIYYDRSGKEPIPYVHVEPWDPDIGHRIDMWLEDVFYAVRTNTEAERDMPRDWCERFCEHYSGCRLFDTDVTGLIQAPDTLAAIALYEEGRDLERDGKRKKEQARDALLDVQSGSTGTHFIRWTDVAPTEVAGFTRAGHRKLDVRKITTKGKK